MASMTKIAHNSPSRQNPSELETAIAGALFDLESNTTDLKATLKPLQFVSAREVRFCYLFWGEILFVLVGNGHTGGEMHEEGHKLLWIKPLWLKKEKGRQRERRKRLSGTIDWIE